MKASTNQQGLSALMVLIALGLLTLVVFQISSIYKSQNLDQPSSTNLPSKNDQNPLSVASKPAQTRLDLQAQTQKLQKLLTAEAALLGVTDNLSLYFDDANHPDEAVSLDPTKAWIPASTIKSYVLLEAFRQNRLGLINFNQTVTVKADNVVPTELETDEYPRLREGTEVSIRQLTEAMIVQSDNTAYNSLLDILDRRNINDSLRNIGITETVVGEKLNLDAGQFQQDLAVPGRQPNTTTAKDLATYFNLLFSHNIPDSDQILAIFKRQKINNMIPARLPENTVIAHKTGDWAPIYHDGGIVYKTEDPFIFVAFTNSGDPAVVAKLAQVAYYREAKYVGKDVTITNLPSRNLAFVPRPSYYLNQPEQVLGENIDNKFPDVTGEDLGITTKDLRVSHSQVNELKGAWLTPGSLFYDLKKTLEGGQLLLSFDTGTKAKTYLGFANNRLSEIKSLLAQNMISQVDQLLIEAISDLKNATNMAKGTPDRDRLIIEIKRTHDLYYAVLEERSHSMPDDKKDQFVDSVYNFYQKEKKEISPVINSLVIVDPTKQKPVIGTVENIVSEQLTLKFDDGSKKTVNLSSATNVRSVAQDFNQKLTDVKVGNKVAVLGPNGTDAVMDAQFILNNIPQGLTDQHKGTVTEVNPSSGVIKVIDQKGQVNLVKVGADTAVKSKDTNVSLEGIKAGSQVVIFGISNPAANLKSPSPSPLPSSSTQTKIEPRSSPSPQKSSLPSASLAPPGKQSPTPNKKDAPKSSTPPSLPGIEIKATSVTVVENSSGKTEQKSSPNSPNQISPKSSAPNSDGNKNAPTPNQNNTPTNKKDTHKIDTKK